MHTIAFSSPGIIRVAFLLLQHGALLRSLLLKRTLCAKKAALLRYAVRYTCTQPEAALLRHLERYARTLLEAAHSVSRARVTASAVLSGAYMLSACTELR